MSKTSRTLSMCIIFLLSCMPVTFAQNMKASTGVPGNNFIPRFAVNEDRGDILVVWNQQPAGTQNIVVWSRWFKKKNNGTYKMRKARQLSPSGEFHTDATVVWIPGRNEYLVVWDTFNAANGLLPSPLMAQRLNKRGKPKGEPFAIIANGRANTWPHLIVGQEPGGEPATEGEHVLLAWSALPTELNDDGGGIRIVELNNDYLPEDEGYLAIPSKLLPAGSSAPDIGPADGPPIQNLDNFPLVSDTSLCLNNDRFQVEVDWRTTNFINNPMPIPQQQSGYFYFFNPDNWELLVKIIDGAAGDLFNRYWIFSADTTNVEFKLRIRGTLEPHEFKIEQDDCEFEISDKDAWEISTDEFSNQPIAPRTIKIGARLDFKVSPSKKPVIGHLVYPKSDGMYRRNIVLKNAEKARLKFKKEKKLFGSSAPVGWMETGEHLDSNTKIIAWQKSIGIGNREIWLYTY